MLSWKPARLAGGILVLDGRLAVQRRSALSLSCRNLKQMNRWCLTIPPACASKPHTFPCSFRLLLHSSYYTAHSSSSLSILDPDSGLFYCSWRAPNHHLCSWLLDSYALHNWGWAPSTSGTAAFLFQHFSELCEKVNKWENHYLCRNGITYVKNGGKLYSHGHS